MKSFDIGDITLIIPADQINDPLRAALEEGRYEGGERAAMAQFLRPDDRVLDLGAGAGLISILAARIVGGRNVVAVEASPKMQRALHRNLRRNGAGQVRVMSGAIVPDAHEGAEVGFAVRAAFWASAIAGETEGKGRVEKVPAMRFGEVMEAARPTFVMIDIEGGELALSGEDWPETVRMIVMEVHPQIYPPEKLDAMMADFERAGFSEVPRETATGKKSPVVVLQRRTGTAQAS